MKATMSTVMNCKIIRRKNN